MSFKCNKCSKHFEVGSVPVKHITHVRPVEYVYGLTKVFTGREVLREVSVCAGCSTGFANLEPELVRSADGKTKQVFCSEPKKRLPKELDRR